MRKKSDNTSYPLVTTLTRGGTFRWNPFTWRFKLTSAKRKNDTFGDLDTEIALIQAKHSKWVPIHPWLDDWVAAKASRYPNLVGLDHRNNPDDYKTIMAYAGYPLAYLVGIKVLKRVNRRGAPYMYEVQEGAIEKMCEEAARNMEPKQVAMDPAMFRSKLAGHLQVIDESLRTLRDQEVRLLEVRGSLVGLIEAY